MGGGDWNGDKLDFAKRSFTDKDLDALPLRDVKYPYREVDFSRNQLSTNSLAKVINLCKLCKELRVLKLYKNGIDDKGALLLADFLRACPWIEEVHLSHNHFTVEGVGPIIEAAEQTRPEGATPLWLRLEQNDVRDAGKVLEDLMSRFSVCPREDERRCTVTYCAHGKKVHLPYFRHQRCSGPEDWGDERGARGRHWGGRRGSRRQDWGGGEAWGEQLWDDEAWEEEETWQPWGGQQYEEDWQPRGRQQSSWTGGSGRNGGGGNSWWSKGFDDDNADWDSGGGGDSWGNQSWKTASQAQTRTVAWVEHELDEKEEEFSDVEIVKSRDGETGKKLRQKVSTPQRRGAGVGSIFCRAVGAAVSYEGGGSGGRQVMAAIGNGDRPGPSRHTQMDQDRSRSPRLPRRSDSRPPAASGSPPASSARGPRSRSPQRSRGRSRSPMRRSPARPSQAVGRPRASPGSSSAGRQRQDASPPARRRGDGARDNSGGMGGHRRGEAGRRSSRGASDGDDTRGGGGGAGSRLSRRHHERSDRLDRSVRITNVPGDLTAQEIAEAFMDMTGKVKSCEIHDENCAILKFFKAEDAKKACSFDGGELNNRIIRVAMLT